MRIRGIDDTLADSLHHLTELANLHEHGVERFENRYAGFLPKLKPQLSITEGVLEYLDQTDNPLIPTQALALAQLRRNLQPNHALYLRDVLRLIWSSGPDSSDYLRILLSGKRIRFDWRRAKITYEPEDEFERALYAPFQNSRSAKVCENPSCPAPFFIARRR